MEGEQKVHFSSVRFFGSVSSVTIVGSIMIRDRGGAHCEQFLQKSLLLSFIIRFKYILSEPVLNGLLTKSQKSFPLITVN